MSSADVSGFPERARDLAPRPCLGPAILVPCHAEIAATGEVLPERVQIEVSVLCGLDQAYGSYERDSLRSVREILRAARRTPMSSAVWGGR